MSVQTTADEKLESAKGHIQKALQDLTEIIVNKCDGADHYKAEFRGMLRRQYLTLLEIDQQLSGDD